MKDVIKDIIDSFNSVPLRERIKTVFDFLIHVAVFICVCITMRLTTSKFIDWNTLIVIFVSYKVLLLGFIFDNSTEIMRILNRHDMGTDDYYEGNYEVIEDGKSFDETFAKPAALNMDNLYVAYNTQYMIFRFLKILFMLVYVASITLLIVNIRENFCDIGNYNFEKYSMLAIIYATACEVGEAFFNRFMVKQENEYNKMQ